MERYIHIHTRIRNYEQLLVWDVLKDTIRYRDFVNFETLGFRGYIEVLDSKIQKQINFDKNLQNTMKTNKLKQTFGLRGFKNLNKPLVWEGTSQIQKTLKKQINFKTFGLRGHFAQHWIWDLSFCSSGPKVYNMLDL